MIVRANYVVDGERRSIDFVGASEKDVNVQLYDWLKKAAEEYPTFEYLGREIMTAIESIDYEDAPEIEGAITYDPDRDPDTPESGEETDGEADGEEEAEESPDYNNNPFLEEALVVTTKKAQPRMSKFEEWFRTFIEEKDLPVVEFKIEHNGMVHYLDNYDAVEIICNAMSPKDQERVKDVIVRLDFMNGDINHFLKYIAENYIKMKY